MQADDEQKTVSGNRDSSLVNRFKHWWYRRRHTLVTPNRIGITTACLIGAVAGVSGSVLEAGVSALGGLRLAMLHVAGAQPMTVLPLFGLFGGFFAGWLVQDFGPQASGSGIPQVKAVLQKVRIDALNLQTALVKFIGGMIVLGCGFLMGREGPTVHVAASLANRISRFIPATPEHRRQLVAAGAGAGLAAAFHAPIAGVMFVLEELLKDISSSTIGTAVLACFVGSVVSHLLTRAGDADDLARFATKAHFQVGDIPWYVAIGVLAGISGAVFNRSIIWMLTVFRDSLKLPLALKVALAGLLSGLIVCLLPPEFANYTDLRQSILLGHVDLPTVSLAFLVFFVLTVLAYGSGAPGGLFAPSLSIGCTIGFVVAALAALAMHESSPSYEAFALAGMGGMFSSVARVPVTAIIIIFEMTQSFELVLPLMIVCIVSSMVADRLYPRSIYDRLMDWSGIAPKEATIVSETIGNRVAEDVMNPHPTVLNSDESFKVAWERIRNSKRESFPVIDAGRFAGVCTLADFEASLATAGDDSIQVSQLMDTNPIIISPDEPLWRVLTFFEEDKVTMLPVVQEETLMGVITRTDLIHTIYREMAPHSFHSTPKKS